MIPVALTIAGSDSGGGAGIQADLKTFSALAAYGCTAITALTAQNTLGVQSVFPVTAEFVRAQLDSIFDDLRVDAVKIGMLGSARVIATVAACLEERRPRIVVLDPVMVAKGGDRLLDIDAIVALRDRLIPLATVITPNLPEAAALLDEPSIRSRNDMPALAARMQNLGVADVLVKGGHLDGPSSPDLLMHGGELIWFEGGRIDTPHTHGTGCTLSAALTAILARNLPLPAAVHEAKQFLEGAILAGQSLQIGGGRGPVHHFHRLWRGTGPGDKGGR